MLRLYLEDVSPRQLTGIAKTFNLPNIYHEQLLQTIIYSLEGIFVLQKNGQLMRQKIHETKNSLPPAIYQIGDIALRIDHAQFINDEPWVQLHPEHVVEHLCIDKYWLRKGAAVALIFERQGKPTNQLQNFYFEVPAQMLTSMRDHINADLATFLSALMLC